LLVQQDRTLVYETRNTCATQVQGAKEYQGRSGVRSLPDLESGESEAATDTLTINNNMKFED